MIEISDSEENGAYFDPVTSNSQKPLYDTWLGKRRPIKMKLPT